MYAFDDCLAIVFGLLTLFVVIYRISYIAVPMAQIAIKNKSIPDFFKSLTLLV